MALKYAPPACPASADHGRLLDWPSATAAFYCPARAHEDIGGTRFYTTELAPAPTSGPRTLPRGPEAATGVRGRRGVSA